jgi:predicted nucleic acid-binding protein
VELIVDTNILVAGLIRDSVVRQVLLHPDFTFYAPDHLLYEIEKHKNLFLAKSKLSCPAFEAVLNMLVERVSILSHDDIQKHIGEARGIIGKIDPDDATFIACALAVKNDGIWTEDRDFSRQSKIRVWSTKELLQYLLD